MMDLTDRLDKELFEKVKKCLERTMRIPLNFKENTSLIRNLGMDSLDFVDFSKRIGVEFGVGVGKGFLEVYRSIYEDPNQKEQFVENEKITDPGMVRIRQSFPYGEFSVLEGTRDYEDIETLITVGSVVSYIHNELKKISETQNPVRKPPYKKPKFCRRSAVQDCQ
ncbi:MAG TPA: acyl carrier protein [Candidatus Paceibacterota bacterium]|nr:acyl carrier protein [Candidatus Paceibacterota bacterium]